MAVVVSCLLEHWAARFLSSLSRSRQNLVLAFSFLGALALATFQTNVATTNCLVLVTALAAGILLSRTVGSVGALVTLLVVAGVVDFVSAQAGPSRWIVAQARQARGVPLLQFLAVSIPLKGKIVPVIGVGDLMFFTVCVAALTRAGWTGAQALAAPLAGLLTALAVGLWAGFTPALPFVAAAVMLGARAVRPTRLEPCRG